MSYRIFFIMVVVIVLPVQVFADSADDDWWDSDDEPYTCDDFCDHVSWCQTPCIPSGDCLSYCVDNIPSWQIDCAYDGCLAFNDCVCGPADDDGSDRPICEDLNRLVYRSCSLSILAFGDESLNAEEAREQCTDGEGAWQCIRECAEDSEVNSCSVFSACLEQSCGIRTRKGSSGDDWDKDFGDNGCGISPNQSGTILTVLMMTIGFLAMYVGLRRQAPSKKR